MSLVHYVRPFLELGICKEYCMARKTTVSSTTIRSKKVGESVQPGVPQLTLEARKDGKPSNVVPFILERETRSRSYDLRLHLRASPTGHCCLPTTHPTWL